MLKLVADAVGPQFEQLVEDLLRLVEDPVLHVARYQLLVSLQGVPLHPGLLGEGGV